MNHSKLFWYTAWMVALAGVFKGGTFLLFDSAVSADMPTYNLFWLKNALMDLFGLAAIASFVGVILLIVMLLSSLSMYFIGKANSVGIRDHEMISFDEPTRLPIKHHAEKSTTVVKKTVVKKPVKRKTTVKKK